MIASAVGCLKSDDRHVQTQAVCCDGDWWSPQPRYTSRYEDMRERVRKSEHALIYHGSFSDSRVVLNFGEPLLSTDALGVNTETASLSFQRMVHLSQPHSAVEHESLNEVL